MPSTPSSSLLFEIQQGGENLNTWGDTRLNVALQMIEAGGHGLTSHTLTENKSLTYTNYTLTDGTDRVHVIASASDGPYTLTLGGFERTYLIFNESSFSQIIACSGGGDSVTLTPGEAVTLYCDTVNVKRINPLNMTGDATIAGTLTVSGVGSFGGNVTASATPTLNAHLVNKQYADGLAFNETDLPGITPTTEYASVTNDGSAAFWEQDIQPEVITANETAIARRQPYLCVMSSSFTLTLPATPSEGDIVRVMTDENALLNNLTIGRNGETIGGLAEDMTIGLNGFSGLLFYTSSNWKVISL